jgi:biotin operon repressor
MVRRYVLLWLTCRDASRPSGRSWAKQLGISHTWLQKVVRQLYGKESRLSSTSKK